MKLPMDQRVTMFRPQRLTPLSCRLDIRSPPAAQHSWIAILAIACLGQANVPVQRRRGSAVRCNRLLGVIVPFYYTHLERFSLKS
jgi:hypothetical protein